MNATVRDFHCEFKDALCDDPRCKLGYCAPEHDLLRSYEAISSASAEEDRRALTAEAREVAKGVLRLRGIKPTEQLIEKLIRLPGILVEAQRRLNWL